MPRLSKRDLILNAIIKAYLQDNLPIGSSELGNRMSQDIPASTIRVYFKKLSEEGELTQLHVSGGRIPTDQAMRQYWDERLDMNAPVIVDRVEPFKGLVDRFGLYCIVTNSARPIFTELLTVNKRFLLLIIGEEKIVLDYNEQIERFLPNLIGTDIASLQEICAQVGLYSLYDKIDSMIAHNVLFKEGEMTVYDMAKQSGKTNTFRLVLDPSFPESLTEGLYFEDILPEGYMAVKKQAVFEGKESQMLCIGKLYTDFESFFKKTKEEA